MVKKTGSSKRWLKEHFDDEYVLRAQREGYRSRACYKLLELNEKDRLIKPGMTVLDLGSAPGSWSQVAAQLVGDNGRVVASDILAMDGLAGVDFIKGDFTEQQVFDSIIEILDGAVVDLVISDMAPNMSGVAAVDQPQSMYLIELALDLAKQILKPGGTFVAKVFQGEGFDQLLRDMRINFSSVQSRKPAASRARSREVYQVGKGFKVS
ncbi:MAG: 23S rRNA (uridine2552-2'-O)-methyltransferase [Oceanicoccus sp.]|jgi:23S rRNA (uridine2552-2'-O)-methyltransferase